MSGGGEPPGGLGLAEHLAERLPLHLDTRPSFTSLSPWGLCTHSPYCLQNQCHHIKVGAFSGLETNQPPVVFSQSSHHHRVWLCADVFRAEPHSPRDPQEHPTWWGRNYSKPQWGP